MSADVRRMDRLGIIRARYGILRSEGRSLPLQVEGFVCGLKNLKSTGSISLDPYLEEVLMVCIEVMSER